MSTEATCDWCTRTAILALHNHNHLHARLISFELDRELELAALNGFTTQTRARADFALQRLSLIWYQNDSE
jgi:hypothetical protein